jgi:A/G-specific adenine glycosylase
LTRLARSGGPTGTIRLEMRRERPVATEQELERARRMVPRLEQWFNDNGRDFSWRRTTDPYHVAVAEVLLQRTRADVVARFLPTFFKTFPTWLALCAADPAQLEEVIRPLGLHRRRAAALLAAARLATMGHLTWEAMPGAGQYVHRAIAVALNGDRLAMVDANFVRVLTRAFADGWMSDYRYDSRLQAIASAMIDVAHDVRRANWAILDLAASVCRASAPDCSLCPLRPECITGQRQEPDAAYPTHPTPTRPRSRDRVASHECWKALKA